MKGNLPSYEFFVTIWNCWKPNASEKMIARLATALTEQECYVRQLYILKVDRYLDEQ